MSFRVALFVSFFAALVVSGEASAFCRLGRCFQQRFTFNNGFNQGFRGQFNQFNGTFDSFANHFAINNVAFANLANANAIAEFNRIAALNTFNNFNFNGVNNLNFNPYALATSAGFPGMNHYTTRTGFGQTPSFASFTDSQNLGAIINNGGVPGPVDPRLLAFGTAGVLGGNQFGGHGFNGGHGNHFGGAGQVGHGQLRCGSHDGFRRGCGGFGGQGGQGGFNPNFGFNNDVGRPIAAQTITSADPSFTKWKEAYAGASATDPATVAGLHSKWVAKGSTYGQYGFRAFHQKCASSASNGQNLDYTFFIFTGANNQAWMSYYPGHVRANDEWLGKAKAAWKPLAGGANGSITSTFPTADGDNQLWAKTVTGSQSGLDLAVKMKAGGTEWFCKTTGVVPPEGTLSASNAANY